MGVWSPAFEHKFLDGNLLNFEAARGTQPTISFEAPVVRPTPPQADRGFPVRSGNRFRYDYEPGLFANVIGADIRLEIAFPLGTMGQTSGNVELGNGTVRFLLGFVGGEARLQFVVNGLFLAATAVFGPTDTLRVQARWHTHGSAQIWVNGGLVRFTPSLAPSQSFTIDSLAFGHHNAISFSPSAPAFYIRKVVVKLLRKDDAQRALNRLFRIDEVDVDANCRRRLAAVKESVLGEMRGFMRQAVARLTGDWRAGQSDGPFSAEGLGAHDAGVKGARAFVEFMLGRPGGDPETVKARIREFLVAIRATDPAAYDQAVERLAASTTPLDAACLAQLQPMMQLHGAELQPTIALLQELWTLMQSPEVTQ